MSYQKTGNKDVLKYNILFLMNGAKPPRGGEYMTLYLITHLRRDIFSPILIYAEEGTIVNEIKKAGIDSVHFPLNRNITGIYPREIKLYNPLFIITFAWNIVTGWHVLKLKRLLKGYNIHLIYCADNLSKLIGGLAGKITGIKVVAHCHDDFKEDLLGRSMRLLYRMFLDRILAVSERVKKFFTVKGKPSQKVITIYNGIDSCFFDPSKIESNVKTELGLKEGSIILGSIGVLEKDKGQPYLLETVARLKAEGIANLVCLVCGTGPEEANLKEIAYARGIGAEMLFLGYRNDIPKILKVLNIVIMTSLTIEACPMTVLEAMAMEVPVIATNVGGLPEVIDDGKTGILIPPGNVDALCEAIKYLIKNPEIRLQMGQNGRARVLERFTIEENVRKTEEVFLEMLKGI